jgi:hypothetical protein
VVIHKKVNISMAYDLQYFCGCRRVGPPLSSARACALAAYVGGVDGFVHY